MAEILLAEDEDVLRRNLTFILNSSGYSTVSARTSVEAMELLRKKHFDVLITDLIMPVKGGGELIGTNHPTWTAYAKEFGLEFLEMSESEELESPLVLDGKKLIPFWRRGSSQGVNLSKVFAEPKDFDLVLWVQGSGALPYLEDGEITSPETWAEFQRVFGGRFIGFAVWIN